MKNLIYFGLLWDCHRCKNSFSSHHPSGCVVCDCTKYWGCSWGTSADCWGTGSELKGGNVDNGKSAGSKTEKLLMPKDKLRASSLSGDRYILLIFKLWFPAFRKLRCTELCLECMFHSAFCSVNIPFLPWNEVCTIQKGSSGEELSKHIAMFFLFPNTE